jgi:hypothetical protein
MRHYAKLLRATLTASLILVAMAGTAVAGAFGDGNAAYKRGDYATAYRLWRPLAERGDAPAQNNVGVAFRYGQGVPQNPAEAEKWFRKAAGQGNADAQYNLGEMQGSQEVQRQRTADILLSLPPWTRQKLGSCKTFARPGEIAIPGVNCTSETPTQRALTPEQNPSSGQNPSSRIEVALKKQGGIFVVPVQINGAITLDFTVDSGAADVSVPADVFFHIDANRQHKGHGYNRQTDLRLS